MSITVCLSNHEHISMTVLMNNSINSIEIEFKKIEKRIDFNLHIFFFTKLKVSSNYRMNFNLKMAQQSLHMNFSFVQFVTATELLETGVDYFIRNSKITCALLLSLSLFYIVHLFNIENKSLFFKKRGIFYEPRLICN